MSQVDLYSGREATKVKHLVLRRYLQTLAYKWGWYGGTINYVDGFAGPWRSEDERLRDTSPHIAIAELRTAAAGLEQAGGPRPVCRCLFVERDPDSLAKLRESVKDIADVKVEVLGGKFEQHIQDALSFVRHGRKPFGFFFIDPTGWTGFGMQTIAPILQHKPGEVLINFMTKDIKRFIDDLNSVAVPAYKELFGDEDFRREWEGLTVQDREDAIVAAYCRRVKDVGQSKFVVSTIVLHPTDNRTHFHLIYATRRLEGLRAFRDVEAHAMKQQAEMRASAQQHKRTSKSGQLEMFAPEDMGDGQYIERLRQQYLPKSRQTVLNELKSQGSMSFDDLEATALAMPMTWTSDLKDWLKEWKHQELVEYHYLAPRARIPQRDSNHIVEWTGE